MSLEGRASGVRAAQSLREGPVALNNMCTEEQELVRGVLRIFQQFLLSGSEFNVKIL